MAITKETIVDEITIGLNGVIGYRESTRWIEDGVASSATFFRNTLSPGQELTNIPEKVVAVCNVMWTPEVIAAYQAALQQLESKS
jgi:hypothetical protein